MKGVTSHILKSQKFEPKKAPVCDEQFLLKLDNQEHYTKLIYKELDNQFNGDGIIRDRHILSEYFDSVTRSNFNFNNPLFKVK